MERPFTAYQGDNSYVFVCYSHDDADVAVVYPEITRLRDSGVNVWYDEGISPGGNWRTSIGEALLGASHVLFYVSRRSLRSDHCNREINLALDANRPIIPIYLEEAALTPDLLLGLSRVQALHIDSDTDYLRKVVSVVGGSSDTLPQRPARGRRASPLRTLGVLASAAVVLTLAAWFLAAPPPGDAAPIGSIAVMPFENLSDQPDQEYFVAGVHDALIGELARNPSIRVISRTSTLRYRGERDASMPEIAKALNVDAVVEGSVLREGNRIAVHAQLIRIFPEEAHIWTEDYDAEIDSILTVHRNVARSISDAIGAKLNASLNPPDTVNPDNYEAYLKARFFLSQGTPEGDEKGMAILHEILSRDPANALANAELALGYVAAAHGPAPGKVELYRRARAAAERALKLDDTLAEAYTALAEIGMLFDYDWKTAEARFTRAIELKPNLAVAHFQYGWMLAALGRNDEATTQMIAARDIDPLNPEYTAWLGGWYSFIGRNDEAVREALAAREIAPRNPVSRLVLGRAYAQLGEFDKAIEEHKVFRTLWLPATATTYALADQMAEAHAIRRQIEDSGQAVAPLFVAEMYAVLGDPDAAFMHMAEMVTDRAAFSGAIVYSPHFESLKGDPRYAALLARMNLAE